MEHLVRLAAGCLYCKKSLPTDWNSVWGSSERDHYKSQRCSCGRTNWVRVPFEGSGHDQILSDGEKTIESRIKKMWLQA